MKKRFFSALIAAVLLLVVLPFSGCSRYASNYHAIAIVSQNTAKSAFMSFSSFEGSMVFTLQCASSEERINYSARLESGSAKIFYDCNGTKTELCSVNSGDDIGEIGGVLQKGTVYIIVEMPEAGKDGRFDFNIG